MYCYWYVMNDYGIPIKTTLYIINKDGYMPDSGDVDDPTNLPSYGNSHYGLDEYKGLLIWDKQHKKPLDMRLFYTHLKPTDWVKCRWDPKGENPNEYAPKYYRESPITGGQICYTPEALLYA